MCNLESDVYDTPNPTQSRSTKAEVVSWPESISTTADLEQAIAEWGWFVSGLSPKQRAKLHRITSAGAITKDEYEHAKNASDGKRKPIAYFLGVITSGRRGGGTQPIKQRSRRPTHRRVNR